jgi:hypothetical protein
LRHSFASSDAPMNMESRKPSVGSKSILIQDDGYMNIRNYPTANCWCCRIGFFIRSREKSYILLQCGTQHRYL